MNGHSSSRYAPFTETEFTALLALRAQLGTRPVFTKRELAHLHFLRWLVRQPNLHRVQPVSANTDQQVARADEPAREPWVLRLKAAYDAGIYRTETAEGEQTRIPWARKSCRHCPFWSYGTCDVLAEYRWSREDTCSYFDPENHAHAKRIIQERRQQGRRRWWQLFKREATRGGRQAEHFPV